MSLHRAGSPASDTKDAKDVEQQETRPEVLAGANNGIKSADAELYEEALARYGVEGNIDPAEEKRVRRKLDRIIIPVLGVSYFYYYVDKTTLSYAAIFGIKEDLNLGKTDYNWLSSIFYFGWLIFAIPSNLLMQRSPPAYVQSFAALAALRVLGGAAEAIADPAFMLFTTLYYTREEQPSRISAWYVWNGVGVAGGGLIGYGIGHIKSSIASWRYEFILVGISCFIWGCVIAYVLPNSVSTFRWFNREEKLILIARTFKNQTGRARRQISWPQIIEAYTDWKTYTFFLLGLIANIPNGGISNFSTLVIKGLGFDTLETALLGIPQGALVVIWISLGAFINGRLPKNSRTIVCGLFMLPTISGALGFLLAPTDAYVGRLICFYLTGSYQASFVLSLSLITSNTGGQTKLMITSGMIWFGACIGNIVGPFFYRTEQAPKYPLGIGSLLVANCLELAMFFVLHFGLKWENKRKMRQREQMIAAGEEIPSLESTAMLNLTDKENPNFEYVY